MAAAMISAVSFCVGIVSPVNQTVYRSFGCQRQCFYGVEPVADHSTFGPSLAGDPFPAAK
jgi:hypothetical protein